jgi:Lon protease-like protein
MPPDCTVPIFPLAGVYLCPGLMLPLHIFEPRYRAMLEFALEGDRRIAMCLPVEGDLAGLEDRPLVHEICGLGEIVEHQSFLDGRANIVLRGCSRLRICEELPSAPAGYRMVRAQVVPEELPADVDTTRELISLIGRLTAGFPEQGELAEAVDAALVEFSLPADLKLEIFSEPCVLKRARSLVEHMPGPRHPSLDIGPDDPRLN